MYTLPSIDSKCKNKNANVVEWCIDITEQYMKSFYFFVFLSWKKKITRMLPIYSCNEWLHHAHDTAKDYTKNIWCFTCSIYRVALFVGVNALPSVSSRLKASGIPSSRKAIGGKPKNWSQHASCKGCYMSRILEDPSLHKSPSRVSVRHGLNIYSHQPRDRLNT